MKFYITSISKTVQKDNFEHGCDGKVRIAIAEGNQGVVGVLEKDGVASLKGLLSKLVKQYAFPDENAGWVAFESGRISVNRLEDATSCEVKENDQDYVEFKEGKIDLWLADYNVTFEIVKETYVPEVAEICRVLSIGDYDGQVIPSVPEGTR